MSDMLETFVRKGIENEIKTNYPHIQHPAGMYAKIVQVLSLIHISEPTRH